MYSKVQHVQNLYIKKKKKQSVHTCASGDAAGLRYATFRGRLVVKCSSFYFCVSSMPLVCVGGSVVVGLWYDVWEYYVFQRLTE